MSERGWTILGVAATIVFGVPAWWSLFVEHPDVMAELMWAMRVMLPIGTFLAGVFTGWHLRRWRSESLAYQITEKVKGMSVVARAFLAYCVDAAAPVVVASGVRCAEDVKLGMTEVKDSGLVKWDVRGKLAIVAVLPETRNAVRDDRTLVGSMRSDLDRLRTLVAAHVHGTAENDVAVLYGTPEAQALRILVYDPVQTMREDRARRLAQRVPFMIVGAPRDDGTVRVGLPDGERWAILEEMSPLIDLGEHVDVSGVDHEMRVDAIEEAIEKGRP